MDGTFAKKYLNSYKDQSAPLLDTYFKNKIKEANDIGAMPVDMLKRLYAFTMKGKRVRGALMMLGFTLTGKTQSIDMLNASLSPELLHAGLLIQDDIIDRDKMRRGGLTIHKQFENAKNAELAPGGHIHFGTSMAILVSDLAFFMGWEILASSNFPQLSISKACQTFAKYSLWVTYGQSLDITLQNQTNTSLEDVEMIHAYKTAH